MPAIPWARYAQAVDSIAEAVGRTPLVRLNRITQGLGPAIYVKVEWYGATGSLKDRIYLHMFERAEQRGDLKPGMRVLECSTGNAGIACAWVAAVKGYACTIVMPEGMSEERKKIMRAYGAELVFTPGGESDVDLSLQRLAEIRATRPGALLGARAVRQSGQRRDPHADHGAGDLGAERRPHRRLRGLAGSRRPPHRRRPLSSRPAIRRSGSMPWSPRSARCSRGARGAITASRASATASCPATSTSRSSPGIITTTTEESVTMARRLAREEGIFCGISSGCNVAAAIKLARRHPALGTIVTPINDTGQRYFTTPLCGEDKHVEIPEREHPLDPYTVEQLDRYQATWEIVGDDQRQGVRLPGRAPCASKTKPSRRARSSPRSRTLRRA